MLPGAEGNPFFRVTHPLHGSLDLYQDCRIIKNHAFRLEQETGRRPNHLEGKSENAIIGTVAE
jgi:hypothetical protein